MSYSKLLDNDIWRSTATAIKERDGFTCQICTNTVGQLHCHHIIYTEKIPALEPGKNLITLCADCHEWVHYYQNSTHLNFFYDEWVD